MDTVCGPVAEELAALRPVVRQQPEERSWAGAAPGLTTVLVCETQPLTMEGVRSLLRTTGDLKLIAAVTSLSASFELWRERRPDVVVLDKGFGLPAVMDWITAARARETPARVVVWGVSMSEGEALRLVQAGALGVVRKSVDGMAFLTCLRAVAVGRTWMEDSLLAATEHRARAGRSNLTAREQQVVELVEQGLKNKEIAREMGIQPGTVKIHLKHIFEKTGVRGRFGLALAGLREKGFLSYPPA